MSNIYRISVENYEDKLNLEILKVKEKIKKELLHNVWAYLYDYYAGPGLRLEKDKSMADAIRIVEEAFNDGIHYV